MSQKLKVLDIFSGIGGFSLGLERTGGFETVAFCEIEPFCRRVLAKHWPGIPIYEDVRELTGGRLWDDGHSISIQLICGGFPCQDISTAGRGEGLAGERSGLWREFARIVRDLRPWFVIVENVSALLSRGLGDVLGDLAALGYDSEWHSIPLGDAGAPHERDRVWIIAHALPKGFAHAKGWKRSPRSIWGEKLAAGLSRSRLHGWSDQPEMGRVVHGISADVDAVAALGNSVGPIIPFLIGKAILESIRGDG